MAEAVFLVSCVSKKGSGPARARDLYISEWFKKARHYVERQGAPWFILSAEHGLVSPEQVIEPYERTLNTMNIAERRCWANRVLVQIIEQRPNAPHLIFLAGVRYREFLIEALRSRGITTAVPMERMTIGKQLRWLG